MSESVISLCSPCLPKCDNPFDRVAVSYLVAGGTTVLWTLKHSFTAPRPYIFQLQVGQSSNPDADDWLDVGAPVTDIFTATDGEQRVWGKIRWQFYRVQLTTSDGVYHSDPIGLLGTLSRHDWRIARELMRQARVKMRKGPGGQEGYLLKRRVAGQRCRHCLDPQTQEIKQPYCPFCFGTGFECGYFFPIACVYASMDPRTYHLNIDSQRGTTADIVVKARMINTWMLSEEDVFINKTTDDRFYIHAVQNVVEMRGIALVSNVEMRPAPATDPLYSIVVPSQLETLAEMRSQI